MEQERFFLPRRTHPVIRTIRHATLFWPECARRLVKEQLIAMTSEIATYVRHLYRDESGFDDEYFNDMLPIRLELISKTFRAMYQSQFLPPLLGSMGIEQGQGGTRIRPSMYVASRHGLAPVSGMISALLALFEEEQPSGIDSPIN